jgi:hypothetical protein
MTGNLNHKGILGKYWKVLEHSRTFHMIPECSSKEDTRRCQKMPEYSRRGQKVIERSRKISGSPSALLELVMMTVANHFRHVYI